MKTLFIPATDRGSHRLMVVLHGLGDSLESYQTLPSDLDLPWLNYLLVNAPNPYIAGYSWFDFPGDPVPGADDSYNQLQQLLDAQKAAGYPTEETMLFGFSQGCLMVWELGVRYPGRFAGCIGISGFMREPMQLTMLMSPVAKQQRFYITHGLLDDTIPYEQSKAQVASIQQAGLRVEWTEIIKAHTIDSFGEMMLIRRNIERSFSEATLN